MDRVIPFPPPLAPPASRLDPRLLLVDVDFRGHELVARLTLRHPERTLYMRLHWRAGSKAIVEYQPTEHIPADALEAYLTLVDRLDAFGFFMESHDGASANDVRLVVDAFFPTAATGGAT